MAALDAVAQGGVAAHEQDATGAEGEDEQVEQGSGLPQWGGP